VSAKIYILLPVHNRRELTRRFIECLKQQTYQNYHLVLVDDGSTDGTSQMVEANIASVSIIKGNGDLWWAGALQQGYDWIKQNHVSPSDLVLIMNDDTVFESDFLERGASIVPRQGKTLVLAQCYDRQVNELIDCGISIDWRRLSFERARTVEDINCLSTRGLFLLAGDFMEIGGFYPRILPHYLSDYEFTIKARRKGMTLITDSELKLWLDVKETGFREFRDKTLSDFFREYFSKRSAVHPLHWFVFIAVACPLYLKPLNWLRVCKWTLVSFGRAAICSLRTRTL
jgi:GT2 family glycosyltransferase